MGESNGNWGDYDETQDEFAAAWDSFTALPDPGENDALDAFVARKGVGISDLVRVGARLSSPRVLAYSFPDGLKFRDIVNDRKWSYDGSAFTKLKIIRRPGDAGRVPPAVPGAAGVTAPSAAGDGGSAVVLAEGETDAAWLSARVEADVAVAPLGAKNWKPQWTAQLAGYQRVLVGYDADDAGEAGYELVRAAIPHAERWRPPAADWCSLNGSPAPALPTPPAPPPSILVPAGALVELAVPEIPSWFEHALLPVGGTMVLHGSFKSFKSWMALDLMAALATGTAWAEFESQDEATKVAVIQYEIPWAYYQERIKSMRFHRNESPDFDENFFTYSPITRPKLRVGNREEEKRVCDDLTGHDISVVLLDPIRRLIPPGRSLNDEDGAPSLVRAFVERLQSEGLTVVLVHHDNLTTERNAGVSDAANMTGSGAWAGDPDTIVTVSRPKGVTREQPQRNLVFLPRNGPPLSPRGFTLGENARCEWSMEPFSMQEEGDADL